MANTYGLNTIEFSGVPAMTGYVVQTYTLGSTPANIIEVFDEDGNRKAVSYDDITNEISLDCVFAGATLPVAGATFTYNSDDYECLSVEVKGENKGAKKISIKGKNSAGISLS